MRFVPQEPSDQLALQAVHPIRQRLVSDRTRLVNQIRGLPAEHGIAIPPDIFRPRNALTNIVESEDAGLADLMRDLARDAREELADLDRRISTCNRQLKDLLRTDEMCRRVGRIGGIGQVTATALVSAVSDRSCFKNGRECAAWLGLVPRQRFSGGKARLLELSKRGDRYIWTLMIHGARALLGKASGKCDARSQWIGRMRKHGSPNIVAVALANNEPLYAIGSNTMASAGTAWSVLAGGNGYQPARTAPAV